MFSFYTLKAPHEPGHFLNGARVHRELVDSMERMDGESLREQYRVSFTRMQDQWLRCLPIDEDGAPRR